MLWYTTVNVCFVFKRIADHHRGLWFSLTYLLLANYSIGIAYGLWTSIRFSLNYSYEPEALHFTHSQFLYHSAGSLLGSVVSGVTMPCLAKLFGRIFCIRFSLVCLGIALVVNAFVLNITWWIGLRSLIDAFILTTNITSVYYITEVFSWNQRAFGLSLTYAGFELGQGTMTALGTVPYFDWKKQFLFAGGVSLLVSVITIGMAEESPRWYLQKGNREKALEIIQRTVKNAVPETILEGLKVKYAAPFTHPMLIFLSALIFLKYLFDSDAPALTIFEACQKAGFFVRLEKIKSTIHLSTALVMISISISHDRILRISNIYICLYMLTAVSAFFIIVCAVLLNTADVSLEDVFQFRFMLLLSFFYVVACAHGIMFLPLLITAEYVPLDEGCSLPVIVLMAITRTAAVVCVRTPTVASYFNMYLWVVRTLAASALLPIPVPFFLPEPSGVSLAQINRELVKVYM